MDALPLDLSSFEVSNDAMVSEVRVACKALDISSDLLTLNVHASYKGHYDDWLDDTGLRLIKILAGVEDGQDRRAGSPDGADGRNDGWHGAA
eukprot:SAG31_NODE_9993_length_1200_cov_0.830154_1_plen_92_part_00